MCLPRDRALTQQFPACQFSVLTTGQQESGLSSSWAEQLLAAMPFGERQELSRSTLIHFSHGTDRYYWILQVQKNIHEETGLFGSSVLLERFSGPGVCTYISQ